MKKFLLLVLLVCGLQPAVTLGTGVPAAPGSAITTLVTLSGLSTAEYIGYLGTNQHIYLLAYGGAWATVDITSAAGAGLAASGSALASFVDTNNGLHIAYLDQNQHVHQLVFNGSGWFDQDLTALTGNTSAASGSQLSGLDDGDCGLTGGHGQHFFYLGTNLHVYQLYFNGSWSNQDLTAQSGNHLAVSGSALTSFSDAASSSCHEHVFYLDASSHVNQLYYNGSWLNQDLTAQTGNHSAAPGSLLAGFEGTDGHEHVFYLSPTPTIHQLYFNGSWSDQNLGGQPASGSSLTSFDDSHGQHAAYFSANGHVQQLYYNGSWSNEDLTAETGNHLAASGSKVSSFIDPSPNEHIVYEDANGHINQLYFNGSWSNQDLTSLSK